MNARRPVFPLACLVASLLLLSACFGSSSGPPLPIAVSFNSALPGSVNVGSGFQVTADVADDSSNKGVSWSCNPSTAGTFSPQNTASGAPTTFTATMVPVGGSVAIIATSVANTGKFASGNVTINAGGAITVSFNPPAPPPSLTISGGGGVSAAQVSATITSTVANAVSDGVDWTATCSGATSGCGTFSVAHTASGTSTSYTAPPSTPAGGLAVTIKAASTLDPADSVTAVINVSSTTPAAFLCQNCNYTYLLSGVDASGPFAIAGQFTADGMGGITGGEQDFGDLTFTTGNTPDSIIAGSYSFTPDGRGTITLTTSDVNIGVNGVETFGAVLISANHLLITEFDTSATGSGTMDLQTIPPASFSLSTLSGGYAFVSGGASLPTNMVPNPQPLGFGGVFNVTGPGVISGAGSVCDANYGGFISTQQGFTPGGGYTGPDAFGRTQITLRPNFIGNLNNQNLGVNGPVILAAYITDATHLKFVEVDPNFGATSGFAVGQGAKTGSFTSPSVLPTSSSYVFTAFGATSLGQAALVATYTSDGVANLMGATSDGNNAGLVGTGAVTGNYTVDNSGTGRVAVSLKGASIATITGNVSTAADFAVYLTGGADPALVLELDRFDISTGSAFSQAAGPFALSSFAGSYGLNYTFFDPTNGEELDATGQILADGQGNLLGLQDVNVNGAPAQGQASTGTYATNATSRFTGSFGSPPTGTLQVSYYVVSATQLVFIETDTNFVTLGLFQLQTPPF
ncbi:MAG TPA: hypothetical protein VJW51_04910 [Candidatus Acidoferrales bacterium]|nr:hypothetical protein [Candidatus Acidoferrales bacterium]